MAKYDLLISKYKLFLPNLHYFFEGISEMSYMIFYHFQMLTQY